MKSNYSILLAIMAAAGAKAQQACTLTEETNPSLVWSKCNASGTCSPDARISFTSCTYMRKSCGWIVVFDVPMLAYDCEQANGAPPTSGANCTL